MFSELFVGLNFEFKVGGLPMKRIQYMRMIDVNESLYESIRPIGAPSAAERSVR